MFDDYIERWRLIPDGDPIITRTSALLPVRSAGRQAILKVATVEEERRGGRLMCWWEGDGAARVLSHDENALLLERACGRLSLTDIVRGGNDDEATRIICGVVAHLHALRPDPPPPLPSLEDWFEPLHAAAATHGGILREAATQASTLLASQVEATVLHGDIHHGNVLDFGSRGWLAIDPKGLIGERSFDYANLFCNPDTATANAPGRLRRQVEVVSTTARLDRRRLLGWIIAWAGLSASFSLQDGDPPDDALSLAEVAVAELQR